MSRPIGPTRWSSCPSGSSCLAGRAGIHHIDLGLQRRLPPSPLADGRVALLVRGHPRARFRRPLGDGVRRQGLPLVYSRMASWLARASQPRAGADETSIQSCVDDPAIVTRGPEAHHILDCIVLLWLALGLPVARVGHGRAPVDRYLLQSDRGEMTVPPAYAKVVKEALRRFSRVRGAQAPRR